jgi:hypothetical protein
MKAILEFELPADKDNFNVACRAMDWALLVYDIDDQIRRWKKYEEHTEPEIGIMEKVQEFIYSRMEDKGLIYPE